MNDEKTFSKVIIQLINLTRSNELKWKKQDPPNWLTDSGSKIESVYLTEYKGRKLRLYEEKYQSYDDFDRSYSWAKRPVLQIIDQFNKTDWEFPWCRELKDLIEAVRYHSANVSEFLDNFLNNDVR
jgi:hypothetical protein